MIIGLAAKSKLYDKTDLLSDQLEQKKKQDFSAAKNKKLNIFWDVNSSEDQSSKTAYQHNLRLESR